METVEQGANAVELFGDATRVDGPELLPPSGRVPAARTVAIPGDYLDLRRRDPAAAARDRRRVRDQLVEGFASGLVIVDFNDRGEYEFAARV